MSRWPKCFCSCRLLLELLTYFIIIFCSCNVCTAGIPNNSQCFSSKSRSCSCSGVENLFFIFKRNITFFQGEHYILFYSLNASCTCKCQLSANASCECQMPVGVYFKCQLRVSNASWECKCQLGVQMPVAIVKCQMRVSNASCECRCQL